MTAKQIILWSTPRSISTAFERAMREIENSKVFHEPYSAPYHFGPGRISERYLHLPPDPELTFSSVDEQLSQDYNHFDVVFSKDQAYYVETDYTRLLLPGLKDFQHTFLIRDPRQSIVSLYKASINEESTGWSCFLAHEAGFKQLYALYNFVKENIDRNPVIIDAVDLLTNPEETFKAYARATQIEYTPHMVSWRERRIEDYEHWDGWYDTLFKSTGFKKKTREEAEKCDDITKFPEDVQKCIEESLPIYQALKSNKLEVNELENN